LAEPDSTEEHLLEYSSLLKYNFLGICTLLEYDFWGVLMTLLKYTER